MTDAADPVCEQGCVDNDADGFCAEDECNDNNASINPAADEVCDGVDNDCDALTADGLQDPRLGETTTCGVGQCASTGTLSCTDGSLVDSCQALAPSDEVCNELDDDCDGTVDDGVTATFYADADGDQFGNPSVLVEACVLPEGYVNNNLDCNDASASVNPLSAEVCDNGVDDDCNDLTDAADPVCEQGCVDNDADGFCAEDECNDNNASINPAADEVCDGVDNDCDALTADGSEDLLLGQATACGVGQCASTGTLSCTDGSMRASRRLR